MSKSNDFGPGANDLLKGTNVHFTCALPNPSFFAIAYATADSYPLPVDGSLIFHLDVFVPPPNHGGKAGLSVPIVSWPSVTVGHDAEVVPGAATAVAATEANAAAEARNGRSRLVM